MKEALMFYSVYHVQHEIIGKWVEIMFLIYTIIPWEPASRETYYDWFYIILSILMNLKLTSFYLFCVFFIININLIANCMCLAVPANTSGCI